MRVVVVVCVCVCVCVYVSVCVCGVRIHPPGQIALTEAKARVLVGLDRYVIRNDVGFLVNTPPHLVAQHSSGTSETNAITACAYRVVTNLHHHAQ